jgi:hypothetical protein
MGCMAFAIAALLAANAIIVPVYAADIPPTAQPLPPPAIPEGIFKDLPKPGSKRLSPTFRMGHFVGTLEETTLATIQQLAGGDRIYHQGDAGESIYWLCYTLTSSKPPQRVWLSSGEMGGREHALDEISVETIAANEAGTPACPEPPKTLQPVFLGGGLTVGSSYEKVIEVLGESPTVKGVWEVYSHQGQLPNGFDDARWLVFRLRNNNVVFVSTGRTISN